MEFSREEQCAIIIFFFCAKGENCVNMYRELVSVCGDSDLDYSNVNRWMAKFPSRSSLGSAVYQSLKHIPKDSYKKRYEKWVGRWQMCLDTEGDSVEK
jgi:hypothetical protein